MAFMIFFLFSRRISNVYFVPVTTNCHNYLSSIVVGTWTQEFEGVGGQILAPSLTPWPASPSVKEDSDSPHIEMCSRALN